MGKKIRVAVIFGGKSAEHEVSLQSARNVYDALDREKYEPVLIGISKEGRWLLPDQAAFLLDADDPNRIRLNPANEPVALVPESRGEIARLNAQAGAGITPGGQGIPGSQGSLGSVDVVFPILHGPFGEDGTAQGLLRLADVPFVGAGVLGSAVGMDKDVMKRLLRDAGIPIGAFRTLRSGEDAPSYADITAALGSPLFIKPANMGSSVGVTKAHNEEEYLAGLREAFLFDTKVIVEEFIKGREIECSVLGNEHPRASLPGEVKPSHEFYSYDAKYLDEKGAALEIPAKIDEKTVRRIQELALETFRALECEGLARVDFFLKDNGEPVVNEINTIPGFTRISMYPKLWEASGLPYAELIDELIRLALERYDRQKGLQTSR